MPTGPGGGFAAPPSAAPTLDNHFAQIAAGQGRTSRHITVSDFIRISDDIIIADATSGAITVTLPTVADSGGRIVTILKIDNSNNVIADGADANINGSATHTNSTQYLAVHYFCDGFQWWTL